jgi:hypothetical protein
MREQSAMVIRDGRHILHEMVAENYVNNDILLGATKEEDQMSTSECSEDEQVAKIVSKDTLSVVFKNSESPYAVA